MNLFDILGPIMIGPSSSHTAGALRIAAMARQLHAGPIQNVSIKLFGSFARTCHGHGTLLAILGGLLGFGADDERIRDSVQLLGEAGITYQVERSDEAASHPNTAELTLSGGSRVLNVRGISIGGGQARITQISGVDVKIASDRGGLVIFHDDAQGVIAALAACMSLDGVNIAGMSNFRERKGGEAISLFEMDSKPRQNLISALTALNHVGRVVWMDGEPAGEKFDRPPSLSEWVQMAGDGRLSDAVIRYESTKHDTPPEEIKAKARTCLAVMRSAMESGRSDARETPSGMSGGDAVRMQAGRPHLIGGTLYGMLTDALAVSESNARMGRIVAAPTAGACGILPAAVFTAAGINGADEEAQTMALIAAGGVGMTFAYYASIAGADGGCQAECGTAASMAAAAAVELCGGTAEMAIQAAALSIKSQMGLVCDPVGGLVEAPCVKRNAFGAMNALAAAELALSGVKSRIPPDEVVGAMRDVGKRLPMELKETALGGLAQTPTALAVDRWLNEGSAK